ncbi:hypothetical protein MexAM1_META1p0316 [Methylorubrum extorquens AM1]|uniref:Uncharacterized protein n=1 Tax=Methylorubrum extorquens (strain ATCC 14718 / DSM 1338 / JCM 2805 / NCIMB 9133 / AM1) TaxID=272630 RepID=C5AS33_METEA|nr:hypothetical protein MexAM1_META1p0316 [Methylorubrum extorquens AM1]
MAIGTAITASAARAITITAVTGTTVAGDRLAGYLKGRRRETAAFFVPEAGLPLKTADLAAVAAGAGSA